jgi:hypothetical protein
MNEHNGYACATCGSQWVRWEHLDQKDCDDTCQEPCLIRCCNEEDCVGEAVKIGELVS